MMTMNIACATDNNYAPYCGIMLTSLFENNKDHSFSVYILSRGLSEEHCSKFDILARKYHSEIKIVDMNNYDWSNCPVREWDRLTVETYFRLVLPDVLSENIHKILYLDADIVINSSIENLYMQDMDDTPLCACVDYAISADPDDVEIRLGVEKKNYFNAGVLLINLSYWRTFHISERCFELINSNPDILKYHDQDALNLVLHRDHHRIKYLDLTYNFLTASIQAPIFERFTNETKSIISQCSNPTIVHFTSLIKPWFELCADPYKPLFLYYKRQSLWADTPQKKNYETLRQYLGWQRRLFEMKIGMREPWFMTRKELRKIAKSLNDPT